TIPLEGHYREGSLFSCQNTEQSSVQISPRWKTVFSPETDGAFPALGLFNQEGNKLSGTFLTETGDYRYLAGNVVGEKIFLSCFDGSHAFLFTATLKDGELNGKFFSGKHYQTTWIATADDNYELTDPDELTYLVNDEPLAFSFNDLKGEPFSYPSKAYKDKVTIIQVMGSWCPNCMDETRYYLELYDKYHDQGLEIILIGYEAGQNEEEYAFKLKRLQERYKVPFTMLVGGAANKNEASKDFSMLNSIISFPTSIFIDKEGKIVKIHTGFNGPGTGKYYEDYTLETQSFLESLLR
ncbi:MAG: thiol-disulfide isomerase/thioredoxin, partial [Psychromonas sp.]